jgi:hypothetical protein
MLREEDFNFEPKFLLLFFGEGGDKIVENRGKLL